MQGGESRFLIKGPAGSLEVAASVSDQVKAILIVCHPHPLFQGSMDNKVVTTLTRSFRELGVTTYRFNYRGVGQSEGEYAAGVGEAEDALAVIDYAKRAHHPDFFILAGFSFGGAIAYRIAPQVQPRELILIAPSVTHFEMASLPESVGANLLVIQGDQDEVVPYPEVVQWLLTRKESYTFVKCQGVSHFFHGHLMQLKQILQSYYQGRHETK